MYIWVVELQTVWTVPMQMSRVWFQAINRSRLLPCKQDPEDPALNFGSQDASHVHSIHYKIRDSRVSARKTL